MTAGGEYHVGRENQVRYENRDKDDERLTNAADATRAVPSAAEESSNEGPLDLQSTSAHGREAPRPNSKEVLHSYHGDRSSSALGVVKLEPGLATYNEEADRVGESSETMSVGADIGGGERHQQRMMPSLRHSTTAVGYIPCHGGSARGQLRYPTYAPHPAFLLGGEAGTPNAAWCQNLEAYMNLHNNVLNLGGGVGGGGLGLHSRLTSAAVCIILLAFLCITFLCMSGISVISQNI